MRSGPVDIESGYTEPGVHTRYRFRVGTTFHGPSPWPHITRAIRTHGTRHATITHLGQDAPTLLPLSPASSSLLSSAGMVTPLRSVLPLRGRRRRGPIRDRTTDALDAELPE
ncbi:hypothetical protein ACFVKB_35590 [Rhodococcus sp. NPDC127530]|uniref:hypothetical protein n=1 Tax=unclassified Rhodococcus (in: high G+C Gram-positive bacteria) TaxID=192944 RepID=UPI0036299CFD